MIVAPWTAANEAFRDRRGLMQLDPLVGSLSRWRSITGILIMVIAGSSEALSPQHAAIEAAQFAAICFCVVPIVVGLHYWRASTTQRPVLRSGMRMSLTTFGLFVVTLLVPTGVLYHVLQQPTPDGFVVVLWAVGMVWWLAYAVVSVFHLTRSVFSVAEVHPMLAPICGVVAVAVKVGVDAVSGDTDGLPVRTWGLLALGGLLSVVALGVYEYRLLAREGHRLFE